MTCSTEGCTTPVYARGWCERCYRRMAMRNRRRGIKWEDARIVEDISYSGMHMRVRAVRGNASEKICLSCGGPAAEWSYVGDCTDERLEDGRKFCRHPEHFAARCVSCHRRYDLAGSKLTVDEVRAIRAEYATGAVTQAALAYKYDMGINAIGCIVRRDTWKWVT